MQNRCFQNLSMYSFLVGCLFLSFSFNIKYHSEVLALKKEINSYNWISKNELNLLEKEISRLENSKYDITK